MPATYYLPGELPEQAWEDWRFADRFGWLPQQVDEIPARRADELLHVDGIIRDIRNGQQPRLSPGPGDAHA